MAYKDNPVVVRLATWQYDPSGFDEAVHEADVVLAHQNYVQVWLAVILHCEFIVQAVLMFAAE